mmetsp:Transcript_24495/g.53515  ORF Transcript_24495/g.53515 Transcript_24495/m.53515 type:complete len:540 (+) Transcript_24495:1130-2749(+)
MAVGRVPLQVLLVQLAAPVNVAELQLQLDIRLKGLVLGHYTNGSAQDLARRLQPLLSYLQLSSQHPDLGEGEGLVRDELEAGAVDLTRPVRLPRVQLLKQGVLDPQVDVPLPVPLFMRRRQVGHSTLVHLSYAVNVARPLLQLDVVKPVVVVEWALLGLLLILEPALADHHLLDAFAVTVLLLKGHKALIQVVGLRLGDVVQRILVDGTRTLHLLHLLLKLGKFDEEVLRLCVLPELFNRPLVALPCPCHVPVLHFKFGVPHPCLHSGQDLDVSLKDSTGPLHLVVPQLKLDVGHPARMVRLKPHPPLKDLARTRHVAQHLLHVDVLVPQLVHTGQQSHGAVPHIACMVDEAVPHLHLHVLEPHGDIAVVGVQGSLPHRACPAEVLLGLLPLGILDPDTSVEAPHTPHHVLKLLPLAEPVLCKLLWISNDLLGCFEVILKLDLLSLTKQLLSCDLLVRCLLVLDLGCTRQAHFGILLCSTETGHLANVALVLLSGAKLFQWQPAQYRTGRLVQGVIGQSSALSTANLDRASGTTKPVDL